MGKQRERGREERQSEKEGFFDNCGIGPAFLLALQPIERSQDLKLAARTESIWLSMTLLVHRNFAFPEYFLGAPAMIGFFIALPELHYKMYVNKSINHCARTWSILWSQAPLARSYNCQDLDFEACMKNVIHVSQRSIVALKERAKAVSLCFELLGLRLAERQRIVSVGLLWIGIRPDFVHPNRDLFVIFVLQKRAGKASVLSENVRHMLCGPGSDKCQSE